jgi:dolichol-phosphate mannosyltransferase
MLFGMSQHSSFHSTLAIRERYRDDYWQNNDPIIKDRLLWRAQAFRHAVHLLPGQRILELGCGQGLFTRALLRVCREENSITAVTFQNPAEVPPDIGEKIELLELSDITNSLKCRRFDCVIAMDLVDRRNAVEFLNAVYDLVQTGGKIVFYESNPFNPFLTLRRLFLILLGRRDPRRLLSRSQLHQLLALRGFAQAYAIYNDFVFAPLTPRLIWLLRNLSILLENAAVLRTMAGSILVHGQKPPEQMAVSKQSLPTHESLRGAISFVIPCYNEEMNVRPLVERLLNLYGECIHEIILVNDGSTDRTANVMAELAQGNDRIRTLHRGPPNGVGRAIADGISRARGRYLLTMDCDFAHLLPEFRDVLDAAVDGYDVVVGSRFSRHSVLLNYPFWKIVANRGFHLLARLLLWQKFRDLTNNLKLMRRDVVTDLQLGEPGFAVNAETGLQPLMLGYSIREVPISWINRSPEMGSSSFRLIRVGGGYWRVLLNISLRQVFNAGPYKKLRRSPSTVDAV